MRVSTPFSNVSFFMLKFPTFRFFPGRLALLHPMIDDMTLTVMYRCLLGDISVICSAARSSTGYSVTYTAQVSLYGIFYRSSFTLRLISCLRAPRCLRINGSSHCERDSLPTPCSPTLWILFMKRTLWTADAPLQ